MKPIKTKAPGKLLLFGDHAVIYGQPCLVAAIDRLVTVTVNDQKIQESKFVQATRELFVKRFGPVNVGFTIDGFSSELGLGTSAAVTVAVAKALFESKQIKITNQELFDFCYQVIKQVQGVGSGFDLAAAIYRGIVYFVTAGKTIERLVVDELPLVIGYSGTKADTATMVQNAKAKISHSFLERSKDIVDQARTMLEQKDWQGVGKLMNQNQELLSQLGVSTDKLDQMIDAARSAGAYGAKLSGAGGGDCMIALVSSDKKQAVTQAIEDVGGKIIKLKLAL
jgi:mevalonate kinase